MTKSKRRVPWDMQRRAGDGMAIEAVMRHDEEAWDDVCGRLVGMGAEEAADAACFGQVERQRDRRREGALENSEKRMCSLICLRRRAQVWR